MSTPPSFASIVGGLVEGISLSNILFGISIAQFYVYTQNWKRDSKWLKCLAVVIIFLETMNTPFLQREQFFYSVLAIGDPTKVANIDWSIPLSLTYGMVTEMLVQGYYLYRMHILTKKVFLTIAMGLLFTIRYALYINCIADSFKYQTWSARELAKDFKPSVVSLLALSMVNDTIVASTMVYCLYHRRAPFPRTQGIVNQLILYFVSTSGILVAVSFGVLASYLINSNDMLYAGFLVIIALANALFGALNTRQQLRNKLNIMTFSGVSISEPDTLAAISSQPHAVQIQVNQRTSMMIEPYVLNTKGSDYNHAHNPISGAANSV